MIDEICFYLFIEAFASEFEENSEINKMESIHGELTNTIPAIMEEYNLEMTDYYDKDLAHKILESAKRDFGSHFDKIVELESSDFCYHLAMSSVGHGVGFQDNTQTSEYIREHKLDLSRYFESSDRARCAVDDLSKKILGKAS